MSNKKNKPKISTNNGKTTVSFTIDTVRLPKGHCQHRSGAGTHSSTPNRLRTRQNQIRNAIKESND